MEKVQRDARGQDNDRSDMAAGPRATARNSESAASDRGAPLSSSTSAAPDAGWEADVSLLAAMGIIITSPKPGGAGPGAGGSGGQAKPAMLPGAATPPKGQPQGRVTPEIKKELQNKKDAKGHGVAAQGGMGQAQGGAQGAQGAQGAAGAQGTQGTQGAQGEQGAQSSHAAQGTTTHQMGPGAPGAPKPPGSGSGDLDATDAHNVERLIALLDHDADPAHRRAAAHALGKLRSTKARAALEKAVRDKDPLVANAAAAALAAL
jgi:hypothetical protein